jgi:hypothetical protein
VRLLVVAILMLMLSSEALAALETQQIGPYTVSFNMNTDMSYQIQPQAPVTYPFGTIYPLVIATDNTTGASISITQYNNLTTSTLEVNEEITALRMALRDINVTSPEEMVIDNMNGFLISGMPFADMGNAPAGITLYQAQYWLDGKDCECGPVSVGKVLVNIASTYTQDVTRGLLNSIHVAASQMPPSTTIAPSVDYLSPIISQRVNNSAIVPSGDWNRPDRSMMEHVQQAQSSANSLPGSINTQQYVSPSQVPIALSSLKNTSVTIGYPGPSSFQVYVDGSYAGTGIGGSLTFEVKGDMSHMISIWDGSWSYEKNIYFESGLPKVIYVEAV